jgi:EAL domain-containing protein (putative c-di-GMP-specific phosphodiesterase class I)
MVPTSIPRPCTTGRGTNLNSQPWRSGGLAHHTQRVAHVANLRTIAEFVEDAAVIDVLRDIGVDFAQGYGIGRPEPVQILGRPAGVAGVSGMTLSAGKAS